MGIHAQEGEAVSDAKKHSLQWLLEKGWTEDASGHWNPPKPGQKPIAPVAAPAAVTTSKRIRQDPKPLLNELETEFHEYLKRMAFASRIYCQAKRYRLGNGLWYKPDFTSLGRDEYGAPKEYAYEVKGPHSFRGGFENLKSAASLYTDTEWQLWWKENDVWKCQIVLP